MTTDETAIRALYDAVIAGWNANDADAMSAPFSNHVYMVGFDGTQAVGRWAAREHLKGVFADHRVAEYVTLVRDVRTIAPGVMMLRADVGMVPRGHDDIHAAANATQTVIASKVDGDWRIDLFQSTPTVWHGRDADVRALTGELQAAYDARQSAQS